VSDLSAQAPPSIEQVHRDNRLVLARLAYLLTGSRDVAEAVDPPARDRRDLGRAAAPADPIATDGTVDGGLPDISVADTYAEAFGCDAR
jgi:hypothetical protein